MIGAIEASEPRLALGRAEADIAGNHVPIGNVHDQGWVVEPPIGVHQKAREPAQHPRRAQGLGEPHRHALGAQIECDVPLESFGLQPERPVFRRNPVLRMVAEEQKT